MSKRPAKALVMPLRLTDDEREFVFETLTKGVHGARVITRARILFKLDKGNSPTSTVAGDLIGQTSTRCLRNSKATRHFWPSQSRVAVC